MRRLSDIFAGRASPIGDTIRTAGVGAYLKAAEKESTELVKSEYLRFLDNLYQDLVEGVKGHFVDSDHPEKDLSAVQKYLATRDLNQTSTKFKKPVHLLPAQKDQNERGKIYLGPAYKVLLYDGSSLLQGQEGGKEGDKVVVTTFGRYLDDELVPLGVFRKTVTFIQLPENYRFGQEPAFDHLAKIDIQDVRKHWRNKDPYGKPDYEGELKENSQIRVRYSIARIPKPVVKEKREAEVLPGLE